MLHVKHSRAQRRRPPAGVFSKSSRGLQAGLAPALSLLLLLLLLLWAGAPASWAAIHYVNPNGPNPIPPYSSWATAATDIQSAVDAAGTGDQILVTNGVYRSGGRTIGGALTNRLAVTNAVSVQSVNGPAVTTIEGYQIPGANNGDSAIRCLWLSAGASVAGFTLTNGGTRTADDASEQSGGAVFAASSDCMVSNCVLTGNSACQEGGAAYGATLNNCALTGNFAGLNGGGACASILNNCALTGNTALWSGGGAGSSTLNNCALTGNAAIGSGGGVHSSTLRNCLVYYNTAPDGNYDAQSSFNSCATTPLPLSGQGNLAAEPQLASAWHLSANSPCRGAGSALYAPGPDLDGEPWNHPPSIGCDEYTSGSVTGALSANILASYTNVAVGYSLGLQAAIAGRVSASVWDFGDATVLSNRPYAAHAWAAAGTYTVVLRAYNESAPAGITAQLAIQVAPQPVHYAALNCTNPTPPYNSWATAATNIQDAVDAATVAGALVIVSNGLYQTGARALQGMSNRVAVTRALTLRSLNGPKNTTIRGAGETRCAYLAGGAVLSGFTLTGASGQNPGDCGGGAWCESIAAQLTNCLIQSNSVSERGGGVYSGTLNNCALTGNAGGTNGGSNAGGGAYFAVLSNCTFTANIASTGAGAFDSILTRCQFTNNSASFGGGAAGCTLNNCTFVNNSADYEGGAAVDSTLDNCTLLKNSSASGGGVSRGTLNNCIVTTNFAGKGIGGFFIPKDGGGAYYATLNNCALLGNSSPTSGGGAYFSTANNSILYYNTAPDGNYDANSSLNYCCTTPLAPGPANFTNAPLFVDSPHGNLRHQSTCPCINAGRNALAPTALDLDGNPRIVGGTVDVGPYEYLTPVSTISYAWLLQYGLPIAGTTDGADPDGDRMSNWQEWVAGTDPTSAASALWLLPPNVSGPGLLLSWNSDPQHSYFVQRASSLRPPVQFSTIATNLPGQSPFTIFVDSLPLPGSAAFYRVGTPTGGQPTPIQLQAPELFLSSWAAITWTSVTNRSYSVERAAALQPAPVFSVLASNILGQAQTTTYFDTTVTGSGSFFYRVRVEQ